MPAKRTRARSRKPRRAPMRKRRMRTRSKKSFKAKALALLPTHTKKIDVFYETVNQATATVVPTPSLSINRLNAMAAGAAGSLDGRAASRLRIKGFRLRCTYVNNLLRPMHVNVAIVTPKDGQFDPADFPPGFFKRYGIGSLGSTDVGLDFGSSDLNDVTMSTLPINTERLNVIWRTRFKLGVISTTGGFSSGELKNYRTLMRYVPINKVISYPSQTSNFPDRNECFYLLTWGTPITWTASEGGIVGGMDMQQHVVMVYNKNA